MHRKVKGILLLLASAGLLYVAYTLDDGQPAAASRLPGSGGHNNGTGGAPQLPAGHPALTAGGSCPLGYDSAGGDAAAAASSPTTAGEEEAALSCEQLQGRGRSADAASCFAQEKAKQLALPGLPGGGVRPGLAAVALGEARSLRAAGRRTEALRVAEEAAGAWRSVDLAAAAAEEGLGQGLGAIGRAVMEARALRLVASLHVSLLGPAAAGQYEVMAGLVRPSAAAAAAALSAAAAEADAARADAARGDAEDEADAAVATAAVRAAEQKKRQEKQDAEEEAAEAMAAGEAKRLAAGGAGAVGLTAADIGGATALAFAKAFCAGGGGAKDAIAALLDPGVFLSTPRGAFSGAEPAAAALVALRARFPADAAGIALGGPSLVPSEVAEDELEVTYAFVGRATGAAVTVADTLVVRRGKIVSIVRTKKDEE